MIRQESMWEAYVPFPCLDRWWGQERPHNRQAGVAMYGKQHRSPDSAPPIVGLCAHALLSA